MKIGGIECNAETERMLRARNPKLFLNTDAPMRTAADLLKRVSDLNREFVGGTKKRQPVEREEDLHDDILDLCKARGWIAIHARMDMAHTLAKGTADFIILADGGRTFCFECKSKAGKLRPEQSAWAAWADRLGHKFAVVRSIEEVRIIVETKP